MNVYYHISVKDIGKPSQNFFLLTQNVSLTSVLRGYHFFHKILTRLQFSQKHIQKGIYSAV